MIKLKDIREALKKGRARYKAGPFKFRKKRRAHEPRTDNRSRAKQKPKNWREKRRKRRKMAEQSRRINARGKKAV